jgi:DNA/RNA-binding protein KIN17
MILFSENVGGILTTNSMEFKRGYLELLRTRYGTRRVLANTVYQEFISDRHHMHMNATCWGNLTVFCKHLGREGEAKVEDTERGWYITYIDQSPEALRRAQMVEQRERDDADSEVAERKAIEEQIRRAKAVSGDAESAPPQPVALERPSGLLKLDLGVSLKKTNQPSFKKVAPVPKKRSLSSMIVSSVPENTNSKLAPTSEPKSALETMMEKEKLRKKLKEERVNGASTSFNRTSNHSMKKDGSR